MARRLLASIALALLLAGCARLPPPPRQPIAGPALQALALLHARWDAFSSLRTLADVTVERGGVRDVFTGVLLVRAPSSVRFEALAPFGQPLLYLVVHDGQVLGYNALRNEAFLAPATAKAMAELVSLPFEPDDLVGVLVGRPAPLQDLRRAELAEPDEHGPSIDLSGADHHQRIWMDFSTGVVRQMTISGGRYEVTVAYDLDADGRVSGLRINAPVAALTASITYRDPVVGEEVPEERFLFTIPAAARVQRLR